MFEGSIVKEQVGPLPMWGWMGLGLGAALAFSVWRKNKAKAAQATQDAAPPVDLIGGDQRPPIVFQDYTTVNTPITFPPGGGRLHPPSPAPVPTPAPAPTPTPTPTPGPVSPPTPVPQPPSTPPPQPAGQWVTVSRWTSTNPPWNSTLWGISSHIYGNGNLWPSVWGNPNNAALVARRKRPELIQPGDRIFVPAR
jgi:nucleoid-associated protein YgaU